MLNRDLNKWDSSGIKHTCNAIDRVIAHLNGSEDPDARDYISEMEDLRYNNEQLREHGAQVNWDLSDKIEALEEEIRDLKDRLSDKEDTIAGLVETIAALTD